MNTENNEKHQKEKAAVEKDPKKKGMNLEKGLLELLS